MLHAMCDAQNEPQTTLCYYNNYISRPYRVWGPRGMVLQGWVTLGPFFDPFEKGWPGNYLIYSIIRNFSKYLIIYRTTRVTTVAHGTRTACINTIVLYTFAAVDSQVIIS